MCQTSFRGSARRVSHLRRSQGLLARSARRARRQHLWALLVLAFLTHVPPAAARSLTIAVIGDYGSGGEGEAAVAELVRGWKPDAVLTVGDNNYPSGEAKTIDDHIGKYYQEFIGSYTGAHGPGAPENRFFPALGNHDCRTPGASPYLDYFTLPGNERYYEFARGPVRFFALNSNPSEPDGIGNDSRQARWLREKLSEATEPWKIVYFHHPPFSSGNEHGSTKRMQWPFCEWGATAVLSGHDHHYERIERKGCLYFVNGLGGDKIRSVSKPVPGSKKRYTGGHGAMRMDVSESQIVFRFINRNGEEIDSFTVEADRPGSAGADRASSR